MVVTLWRMYDAKFRGIGDYLESLRTAAVNDNDEEPDWEEMSRVDYPFPRVTTQGWLVTTGQENLRQSNGQSIEELDSISSILESIKTALLDNPYVNSFFVIPLSRDELK